MRPLGAKYSPAPWVGDNYTDYLCVYANGEEGPVEVCYQDQIEDEEEVLANMRLIKNAPELFELLVEMMHEGCIETTYADRVREMVEKVLQQEEGR